MTFVSPVVLLVYWVPVNVALGVLAGLVVQATAPRVGLQIPARLDSPFRCALIGAVAGAGVAVFYLVWFVWVTPAIAGRGSGLAVLWTVGVQVGLPVLLLAGCGTAIDIATGQPPARGWTVVFGSVGLLLILATGAVP